VCWHSRYTLGDEQPGCDPSDYEIPEGSERLPLYLYDHGGITMSTGAFSCAFDSGQVGWIFATPDKIREVWGIEEITDEVRETVRKSLKAEVAEYDAAALCGNVYGFVLERAEVCGDCGHVTWTDEESCWGFIDLDDTELDAEGAKGAIGAHLPDEAASLLDAAWENRGP
jgi:hypothetical protein